MMGFFDADGTVLHVARAGQGRPLVFVNSLGSDFRIWDDVLPALTPRAEVIRYDKRGHGLSDLGPISMDAHVADLAALLDGLATGPAVVCGLSVGGQIALGLSAARPDLIRGLILMDTGHRIGTPAMWDDRIATVEPAGIAGIAAENDRLTRWFTPAFHATRPADLAGARNMLIRTPVEGYLGTSCRAIRDADFTGCRAGGCGFRRFAWWAIRTAPPRPHLVAEMAGLIPGARFEIVADAGHLPCIEQPGVTAALIGGFLDALEAGAVSDRRDTGMAVRRAVLGDAHVDRAEAAKTPFDAPFQELIVESAWGTVWASDRISRRERSMLTLAVLAATGNFAEIPMHVRATRNTGASQADVMEAFLHAAIYAGVPRANEAIRLAKQTYAEMEGEG
jgi:3-oxoadipate enol-lactonase/4-carboxymuconolactone decarboxylase